MGHIYIDNASNIWDGGDYLAAYKAADIDIAADTKYYGFTRRGGWWYIIKEVTSTGTFRFTKGTSAYSTAWTNRASATYDYFDNIF